MASPKKKKASQAEIGEMTQKNQTCKNELHKFCKEDNSHLCLEATTKGDAYLRLPTEGPKHQSAMSYQSYQEKGAAFHGLTFGMY